MAQAFRRPRRRLSSAEVAELVAMRDVDDATWQAIGRRFDKQESKVREIYAQAKAAIVASNRNTAQACAA